MNTGFTSLEDGAISSLLGPGERIVLDHLVNSLRKTAGPLCKLNLHQEFGIHLIVAFCMWLDSSCCDRALLLVLILYSLNYIINKRILIVVFHVFCHTSLMCLYMDRVIQEQSVKLGRYISQVILSKSIPVNTCQIH
jgi:hypothetical protein